MAIDNALVSKRKGTLTLPQWCDWTWRTPVRDNLIIDTSDAVIIPGAHDAGESCLRAVLSETIDLCQIFGPHDGSHWLSMPRDHHRLTSFGAGNAVGEMGFSISNRSRRAHDHIYSHNFQLRKTSDFNRRPKQP
jgi:hypothetical protein